MRNFIQSLSLKGYYTRPFATLIQKAVAAFSRLNASVLMPGAKTPVGLLNLLPTSDASAPAWTFFNVSGTATRVGNVLTFGNSGIDRLIKTGGGLNISKDKSYTCAVKLSGTGTVRVFFVDGQGSTYLATTVTLTTTPTYYVGNRISTATGTSGGLGIYGDGNPSSFVIHETGIFYGNITVNDIENNGGIPLTQSSAESFNYTSDIKELPYMSYSDSTFVDELENISQIDQSIGGALDSNQSINRNAQVLNNPNFNLGSTGWTVTNTDSTHIVTFSNGTMRFQSDTTSPVLTLTQTGKLSTFCMYRVTGYVSAITGTHPNGLLKSDALGGVAFARQLGEFEVFAVATTTAFTLTRNTTNVDVTLDWIKCEQVSAKSVGPNLISNGGFDNDVDWTKGTGWTISGGIASKVAGSESNLSQVISGLDQNKLYEIGIKYSVQAGVLYIRFGSLTNNYGTFLVDGEQTLLLKPNGTNVIYIYGNASFVGWVDNITVKEITDINGVDYSTNSDSEDRAISVPLDTLTGFSGKEKSSDVYRSYNNSTKLTSISGSRLHYWNIRTVPANVAVSVSGWIFVPSSISQAIRAVDTADGSFIHQIAAANDTNRWVYFRFVRPAKSTQWTLALGQNSVGDWGTNSIYFDDLSVIDINGEIVTQLTTANKPFLRRGIVNRILNSEGIVSTYVSNGVTTASISILGKENSIQFPETAITATAYKSTTLVNGRVYTIAFYAQMDDNSIPIVPNSSTSGDFCIQVNNNFSGADSIVHIGNNVYLIVKTFTSTGYTTSGVVRYASQSLKGFKISGIGLFDFAYTANQIINYGGVPKTINSAASSDLGKQYYEFDGVSDLLTHGRQTLHQNADNWVCVSFKLNSFPQSQVALFSNSNTGTVNPLVAYLYVTNTGQLTCLWRDDAGTAAGRASSLGSVVLGEKYVATACRIGDFSYLWLNGVLVSSASNVLGVTTINTSTIGALVRTSTTFFLHGDIYHLSFGQSTLTESERPKIEALAAQQAGIIL
jgi:hypothetical protein